MSIVFCVNFLKDLEDLLSSGDVDIDLIKYPSIGVSDDALKRALKLRPVNLHGFPPCEYYLGNKTFIQKFDINKIIDTLNLVNANFISAHLEGLINQYHSVDKNTLEKIVYKQTIENIQFVKSNISLPFLLENTVPCVKNGRIAYMAEADFIKRIVEETDNHFLLDTAHAKVAASYLGIRFVDYLNNLPLDKLYEVHLNGTIVVDGQLKAPHTKLTEDDYELLKYLLKNTPVRVVTLEYGPVSLVKDYNSRNEIVRNELLEQVNRIKNIIS